MAGTAHEPPLWFSAKQKRYARLVSNWTWTASLLWLLCLVPLGVVLLSRDKAQSAVRIEATVALLLVGTVVVFARIVLKPGERARRYERAARLLESALVRYQADSGEGPGGLEIADDEAHQLLSEPFKTQY